MSSEVNDCDDGNQTCEAVEWPGLTGCLEDCPNEATHTESWFDDEGVEVDLCDDHAT